MTLTTVRAEYVLPYPSAMPGNKLYTITRIVDGIKKYWSFGNLAKERYHRALADKYLVQAKVLFEYKQYLLASQALEESNNQFTKVSQYLMDAYGEEKDISKELETFTDAANKHIEVLVNTKSVLPNSFDWIPEKEDATNLKIGDRIKSSIELRQESIQNMRLFLYCVRSISADIPVSKKAADCKKEYTSFSIPINDLDATESGKVEQWEPIPPNETKEAAL